MGCVAAMTAAKHDWILAALLMILNDPSPIAVSATAVAATAQVQLPG